MGATLAFVMALGSGGSANGRAICVDAGHGGTECGAGYKHGAPGNCEEKVMNLNVAIALDYLLDTDPGYEGVLTRTGDDCTSYSSRIQLAEARQTSYWSIHHNGIGDAAGNPLPNHPMQNESFVMYCDQSDQASWAATAQSCADATATNIQLSFGGRYVPPLTALGEFEDAQKHNGHTYIQEISTGVAIIGEACGTYSDATWGLCNPTIDPSALWEAYGYFYGIHGCYGTVSVGNSFAAAPAVVNQMLLTWEESDPLRSVVYAIYEADNCLGPFDRHVATVHSNDPAYTDDGVHYVVHGYAPFNRPYYYRMFVADEEPQAEATQTYGMQQVVPVGSPALPEASAVDNGDGTGTVTLNWTPGGGTATGYYVYRSLFDELLGCGSRQETVATVTSPSFVDAEAPINVPLFYRVRAFNETTASGLSPQVSVAVLATVGVEQPFLSGDVSLRFVGANPGDGAAHMLYSIPQQAHVQVFAYDVAGRVVRELESRIAASGAHRLTWDGTDRSGSRRSGVYFLKMWVDGKVAARGKVVLLR